MNRPRLIALTGALAGSMLVASLVGAGASSHREAPLITEDPVADNTDVYAFVPPNAPDNVALIANWIPLEEPASGPNFHKFGDDVLYTINVDNDGDAVEDIIFEFRFRTEVVNDGLPLYNAAPITFEDGEYAGWNIPQTMTVTRVDVGNKGNGKGKGNATSRTVLGQDLVTPPVNVGPRSTPDYAELADNAIHELDGGVKVFAGQRDEIFPVDLGSVFDLLGLRPFNELHAIPLETEEGVDTTSGFNVHSIAIELPKELLTSGDEDVIGVWSDTYRRKVRTFAGNEGDRLQHKGPWVQVSRLGNPLVNEVVIPLRDKDRFNASDPADDGQFLDYVQNTFLDDLVVQLYGEGVNEAFDGDFCFPDPTSQRDDLVAIFLTGLEGLNQPAGVTPSEQLRLNTSIPPTDYDDQMDLGVLDGQLDGFPNGRRPIDDVLDISLQAIAGAAGDCAGEQLPLGDGVAVNGDEGEPELLEEFPYLPAPHQGYDHLHDHTSSDTDSDS